MADFPHHKSLRLQNFTAFQDVTFDFVPGINVLIGENGVGKTHVMKALYSVQLSQFQDSDARAITRRVFQTEDLLELTRSYNDVRAAIESHWTGHWWTVAIRGKDAFEVTMSDEQPSKPSRPVFIPAIDMMGHTRRFLSTYDEYQIDFDQTHRDIVALLLSPERRESADYGNESMAALAGLLGGTVEEDGERFYLKTPQGRQPMPLVAEGLRRIATLHQLYRNGFLRPGGTLFWDEPENNLNPILMDEVVRALLSLARSGVQIFLATHSYFVLKELDLQAGAEDSVRYFALERTGEGTKVHATDDYAQLSPNPIAEQFDSIYDRELTRATGRPRRK